MDQLTKMLKESNDRMEKIIKGNYNERQIDQGRLELLAQLKVFNFMVSAYAVDAKTKNGDLISALKKKNIMDKRIALDTGSSTVVDMITCELNNKVISRHECLDLSGNPPKGFDCSGCEHFATTRQMLVDGNE